MKRILALAVLSLASIPVIAQPSNPTIIPTAPPVSCFSGIPLWVVYSTGTLYVCDNGTPIAIAGGGSAYNPAAVAITGGTIRVSTVNGVVNAVVQSGADMGGKIVTACGVASVSGIIDARGFTGAQTWASADISTACAGKTILLSKGQTITTSGTNGTVAAEILLGSGTTLDCGGAHLFMIAGAGQFERMIGTVAAASNVEIKNCELDGNGANNTNVAVQNHAIMLNNASHVSIHGCYWHNFNGDGVMLWGASGNPSSDVNVYNNWADSNQRTGGVSLINGQNVWIAGNHFSTTVGFEQIHAENDSSSGEFASDVVADGNFLYSPPGVTSGISCSAQVGEGLNVSRWTIVHNHIVGGRINIQRCPYTTAAKNTLTLSSYERPINLASHHVTLDTNTITALDSSVTPSNQAAGITVDNSSVNDGSGEAAGIGFNILINNTIDGVANRGIKVINSSYNQVKNNPVRNIQQVSGSAIAIIQQQTIGGLTTDNQIQGNTITDTQGSPTTQYGVYWDGAGNAPIAGLNDITNMVTASTFGTLLGLGTASTHAATDFATAASVAPATTSTLGTVKPDGTTITVTAGGIITSTNSSGAALSYQAWCTGTVGTANAAAYNLAPDNAGLLCNATTQGAEMPMSSGCTAKNLYVVSHTAGSAAGSGAISLLRAPATNGTPSFSATTLTCTMGTNTQCSDLVHTVSFSTGDRWRMTVTTGQATDTTANIGVNFVCQ